MSEDLVLVNALSMYLTHSVLSVVMNWVAKGNMEERERGNKGGKGRETFCVYFTVGISLFCSSCWVANCPVHCEPRGVQAVCSQYCMIWDSSVASHSIKLK